MLYISLASIFIDCIVGFDIFINVTERLGFLLKLVFLSKLVTIIPIFSKKFTVEDKSKLFLLLLLLTIINSCRGFIDFSNDESFLPGMFFYFILVFGLSSGFIWSSLTNSGVYVKITNKLASFYTLAVFVLTFTYFVLYCFDIISYFGLGLQNYIVTALLLSLDSKRFLLIQILSTLMTGKRSLLLVLFAQLSAMYSKNINLKKTIGGISVIVTLVAIAYNLNMLDRFEAVFAVSVSDLLNYNDKYSFDRLYIATSGRSNEVISFFESTNISDLNLWVGFPLGTSFAMNDYNTGDLYQHHYFHISFFNYIKNFGMPVAALLLIFQFKALFFAMKHGFERKDLGLLMYIGYFFASFFGSVVTIDVLFWMSFSYAHFQRLK